MFSLTKGLMNVKTEVLESAMPVLFPKARLPSISTINETQVCSYEEISQELGFVPQDLILAQLFIFFHVEKITIFSFDEVDAWLKRKKREAGATHWCWHPLRQSDAMGFYYWGYKGTHSEDGYFKGDECQPYSKLVPKKTLEKVKKIEAKFGNNARFFVSDYASPKPDPFIMVRPAKCDSNFGNNYNIIFDVWNEPGF